MRNRRNEAAHGFETCSFGQRGFTLIELLVVIAVIAVLAGLLLPVLARAKGKAREIQCVSRQRQWALAFIQYAADHDDYIAREGTQTTGTVRLHNWLDVSTFAPTSGDAWFNALPLYLDKSPASAYASPELRPGFYEEETFFHCPSAKFPAEVGRPSWLFVSFSMAMNSQLISPLNKPTTRISRVTGNTVLFLDNLLDGEEKVDEDQDDYDLGQPAAWASRFAGRRHGDRGTLAMGDGSVAAVQGTRVVHTEGIFKGRAPLNGPEFVWEPD